MIALSTGRGAPGARVFPLSSPLQVDAHRYPEGVLVGSPLAGLRAKATPKFERGKRVESGAGEALLVSGTAAIRGERSVARGDAAAQARTTLANIAALTGGAPPSRLRAYVKREEDIPLVRGVCERALGPVPALYVTAEVRRDELLVEIEGALAVRAGRAGRGRARGAPAGRIDELVQAELARRGIEPAHRCSDAVFIRRVHLDLTGRLPAPDEVLRFLDDARPEKSALLVDALLSSEAHADLWAARWCDVLRVKAEFPINLWPEAAQAYHRWIRGAVRENLPLDRFARALLTSSGSNFRDPPVNFYRAVQMRDPASYAQAAALTFMGARIERWPEERRRGLAAFFSRVAVKPTRQWKEEIVYSTPTADAALEALLPDGKRVRIAPGEDPRRAFADWLLAPGNPHFARHLANRTWTWVMGRGIIHEADDIRPDNPPSNPALLAHLEASLARSGWDQRRLIREIALSETYRRSPIPRGAHAEAEALLAHAVVRRLDAEVLADLIAQVTGTGEGHASTTPEPYGFTPEEVGAVGLPDGSITSPFLEMFGRPSRDTGRLSERDPSGA